MRIRRVAVVGLLMVAGACTNTGTTEETTSSSSSGGGGSGGSSGVVGSSSRVGSSAGGSSNAGTSQPGSSNTGTSNAGTSNAGTSNAGTSNAGTSNAGSGSSVAGTSNAGSGSSVAGTSTAGSGSSVAGTSTAGSGSSAAGTSTAGTSVAGSSSAGGGSTSAGGGSTSVGGNSSSTTVVSSSGGVGSSSGGGGGDCGSVTLFGECNGTVLRYCNPTTNMLVTMDCATRLNGQAQGCGLISANWGYDCYSPVAGLCLVDDGTGTLSQLICEQPGGACLGVASGNGLAAQCRGNVATCTPDPTGVFVPVCLDGTTLAIDCAAFEQPFGYDCVSAGGTGCSAGTCVNVASGRICDPFLQCAPGLTCLDDGTGTTRCQTGGGSSSGGMGSSSSGGTGSSSGGSSGGLSGSAAIAALRASPDGVASIQVDSVLVSYVKPGVGNDAAGFFIQNDPTGPAIYVAVNPATLTPIPVAGDAVSFVATSIITSQGQKRVDAISTYARVSTGNTVAPAQNLSAATDVVTGLDGYESELVTVTGTVASAFALAGTGYQSASLVTAGIPTQDANFKIRLPDTIISSTQIRDGCTVTVTGTPLWRFTTQAQVMAWNLSEVSVTNCPILMTNATVVINEVNANVASCDLLELRVTAPGTLGGLALHERSPIVATLPNVNVVTNDIVVIHFNNGNVTCAPSGAVTETNSKTESTAATSFATAWDIYIADTGITNTDNTLWITDPLSVIMDAVLLADDITGTAAADSEVSGETVRAANHWTLPDGTLPAANFYVDDAFCGNAVQDLNGTATVRPGLSIQRNTNLDSNNLNGWTMAAETFGTINVGQLPLP